MSYRITLKTRDGQQIEFDCDAEQSVQDAAEVAGYYPPALCKEGGCGTCLGACHAGDYTLGNHSASVLSAEAAARGDVLLCKTYPKDNLQLTVPYDADRIHQKQNPPREAEIVSVEPIAERTVSLVLQLKDDPEVGLGFEFEPGEYVELAVPGQNLKRAYSIANIANWEGRLEFLIRLQKQGQFSEFLQQAKAGEPLWVHAPTGAFQIQAQSLNPRCFVAGGTGFAPFLSMLRRMVEWGEDHPTHLFLGVNNEGEILCQQELASLQQSLPQLTVQICIWKPEHDWDGFIGTPVDALKAYFDQNEAIPDVYLCGPPILVEAATDIALQSGVHADHIYSERFVSS